MVLHHQHGPGTAPQQVRLCTEDSLRGQNCAIGASFCNACVHLPERGASPAFLALLQWDFCTRRNIKLS